MARTRVATLGVLSIVVALLGGLGLLLARPEAAPAVGRSGDPGLRIAGSAPGTWDPAIQGDVQSASFLAQVYEGLTAFDANSDVQPALAQSWRIEQGGRRLVFRLRPDLRFSDGSPLEAQDVVDSWLRIIDPEREPRPPLASLLSDVVGADDYFRGRGRRDAVGLHAQGEEVVVDLRRPATYFLAVTASPSLAVVPRGVTSDAIAAETLPRGFVSSGAYVATRQTETTIRLEANEHYWAGAPPIKTIEVVTDLEGRSPVVLFEDGELDYVGIGSGDASWIRYDARLGPQLREVNAFAVEYYGFDTTRRPFDDARVRRAFAQAVDWDRIVRLSGPDSVPATSLVPPGVTGRSESDFSPRHDPAAARRSLAEAGYPGGKGFPEVKLVTSGFGSDRAVVEELEHVLGVPLALETMPFDEYFRRLDTDPPRFWALSWIADYPAAHDFLGLLLETGSTNNYGGWSDPRYDAALAAAAATATEAEQERHYAAAQRIVQDQAPVVPLSYGRGWALSREGLRGAIQSSVGLIRYAGLAWAE